VPAGGGLGQEARRVEVLERSAVRPRPPRRPSRCRPAAWWSTPDWCTATPGTANPEGFDPTRFLPEAAAGRHRYAYLPFGGGRRQCVGGGFAVLEATLLLAAISQRCTLNLLPGAHPTPQPTVTSGRWRPPHEPSTTANHPIE